MKLNQLKKFFTRAFSIERNNADMASWLINGGGSTTAENITAEGSLRIIAVYACVKVISETIAMLPLNIFKTSDKSRVTDIRLSRLLHDEPNPHMTSSTFRETLQSHILLWGNGYVEIEWDRAGRAIGLWPIPPWRMRVKRDGLEKYYVFDSQRKIGDADILHIPGFGFDGLVGLSPINLMRQSLGLTISAEAYGRSFFKNGSRPSGILEHPGKLKPEAAQTLRSSWNAMQAGDENHHKVTVLEEGMKWVAMGVPPEEAQFLETRKFQTTEIARIYRVPPHMIADLERATFSNIEHQSINFVVHTMMPWLVKWEQEINRKLFADKNYYAEFTVAGLLRGDTKSRFEAYASGINAGWMTRNEARKFENMPPIDGLDKPLQPLNMTAPVDRFDPAQQGVN